MKVPVFLHHHISYNNYSPENFEAELSYLKENGYKTLSLSELSDFLSGKKKYDKSLMLTFDDGYADNYICAYPLLKKYGYNAVVFISTSYISDGSPRKTISEGAEIPKITRENERIPDGFLRWSELEIMLSNRVFEVGSHTQSHKKFNKRAEYENLEEELSLSKKIIKEKLKVEANSLAWPWGHFNQDYIEIAKKCGYELIFTTITGSVKANDNPLEIKRINVLPHRNPSWFKNRLKLHTFPIISDIYPKVYGIDRIIKKKWKR